MAQLAELTENFKELRLKTPEEIEKAVVDESLNPVERAIFLLCSGEDVQKISVLTDLAQLLKSSPDEVQRRVLPKIREMIAVCSLELHQTASRSCIDILQKNILPPDIFAKHFLGMIITGIDLRDVDISVMWLDTLLEVVDLLPNDVVTAQILPKAQHFSHSNQPSQAKLAACKLLGKIAIRLPNTAQRKSDIVPHIKSLAQELEFEVRAAVCFQLSLIAKGLSQQEVREIILPELLELCNDDDFHVRTAGLEAVVTLAPQFDNDTIRASALPFILKFFRESISGNTNALPSIASVIGRVCMAFSSHFTNDEKQFCIECYKRLCTIGVNSDVLTAPLGKSTANSQIASSVKSSTHSLSMPNSLASFAGKPLSDLEARPVLCRENAAANFPTMFQFCGLSRFKQDLRSCFTSLCTDGNPSVRRSIAGCFHELIKLLDADAHMLTKEISMILDDNNLDVLERIVANFDVIAGVLVRNNFRIPATPDSRPTNSGILLNSLFNCDQTLSRALRWRAHVDLMTKLASTRLFCSNEVIYQKILPVLFNRLASARQLPLKLACIRTILILIRTLDRYERWMEIFQRLTEELLHSSNSYRRSLYVDLCNMVLELYSRAFFKQNCLELVLTLAQDPVPNLRIRLCELLLKVKTIIRLPADRTLLQALESAVRKLLLNETDRAVSSVVIKTVEKLDKIEVKMQPISRATSLPTTTTNAAEAEADLEDAKREEEERMRQEADERDKKDDVAVEAKKNEKGGSEKAIPGKQGAVSRAQLASRDSNATATGTIPATQTGAATGAGTKRVRTSKKTGALSREMPTSTLAAGSLLTGSSPINNNGKADNGNELLIGSFPIPHSNSLSKTTTGQPSKTGKPVALSKTIPGINVDDYNVDEITDDEDYEEDEDNINKTRTISVSKSIITKGTISSTLKIPTANNNNTRRQSLPSASLNRSTGSSSSSVLPVLAIKPKKNVNKKSSSNLTSPEVSGLTSPRVITPRLVSLTSPSSSGVTSPTGTTSTNTTNKHETFEDCLRRRPPTPGAKVSSTKN